MDSLIEFSDIIEVDDETIDLYSIDNELFIKDHEGAVNLLNFLYLNSLSSDISITYNYTNSTAKYFIFTIVTGRRNLTLTMDSLDFSTLQCEGFQFNTDTLIPYLHNLIYKKSVAIDFMLSFESSRFEKVSARCSQSNNSISIRFLYNIKRLNTETILSKSNPDHKNVFDINPNILYLNSNKEVISYSIPMHLDHTFDLNYKGQFTYNGLATINDFFEPIKSVLQDLKYYDDFKNLNIYDLIKLNFNISINNEINIFVDFSKYINGWQGLNERLLILLKKHFYKMDSPDYNQFWLNITQYMESVLSINEGFSPTISSTADIDQYLQLLDYNNI